MIFIAHINKHKESCIVLSI